MGLWKYFGCEPRVWRRIPLAKEAISEDSRREGATAPHLGIRYEPGVFSSKVARIAPLALASLLRWPSVICLGVRTQAGRSEISWLSGMNVRAEFLARFRRSNKVRAWATVNP